MADKQISDLTSASAMTDGSLFVIEQGGAAKSANWGMMKNYISPGVAAQYSSSAKYNVGDYVIYNGQLYRCNTPITTPESWTAAHWTQDVLAKDVADLQSALVKEETYADWIVGGLNPTGGTNVTNNARIRLTKFVGINTDVASVRSLTGYEFSVFAWDDSAGMYVGTYTSAGVFTNGGTAKWMSYFNFAAYPAYKFKIVLRNATSPSAQMSVSDGSNGVFAVCRFSQAVVVVNPTSPPTNTNLDDVANNTFVMGQAGSTYINAPSEIGASAFTLETTLTANVKIQTLYLNDGSNIFRRRKIGTNPWSSWTSLLSGVNSVKVQSASLPNNTNLDDIANNTFAMGATGFTYINAPSEIGASAFTLETTLTSSVKIQTLYLNDGSNIFRRRKIGTNPWSSWTSLLSGVDDYEKERELRILAIGNSYTRDNLSYVPFIINNVDPTINLTLGISYASGATLAQYAGWFANDTATLTYNLKKPGTSAWESQQTSKTLKYILDDQPWDIILFQQASSSVENYSSISGYLGTLINDVVEYVGLAHGGVEGHTVKLGFLFPQLRRSVETASSFDNICANMQKILDDFAIDFIVPCGTAIQNARNTTLNNYGASGGMCYDSNGHLQEGIGCLCGAYTVTLKLLEVAYRGKRSVLGDNTRPDAAWVTSRNIPEPNPSSPTDADVVGVTNENCLIAQKCAVQAIKKPYIVSPIN